MSLDFFINQHLNFQYLPTSAITIKAINDYSSEGIDYTIISLKSLLANNRNCENHDLYICVYIEKSTY